MGQPDSVQRGGGQQPPLGAPDAGVQQPVGHVAQHALVLGEEELLEHEPDPDARSPANWRSVIAAASRPVMRTVPLVGLSRVPIRCSSVDLPDPDGPTMAASSPAATARLT